PGPVLTGAARPRRLGDALHLRLDAGERLQPEIVQLLRGPLRPRVVRDQGRVARAAAGQRPQPHLRTRLLAQLAGDELAVAAPPGEHLLDDRPPDPVAGSAPLSLG